MKLKSKIKLNLVTLTLQFTKLLTTKYKCGVSYDCRGVVREAEDVSWTCLHLHIWTSICKAAWCQVLSSCLSTSYNMCMVIFSVMYLS